jgi:hypothetical protein|tara:strand:- start:477 stop:686 length:210 start_codon:yes stop_codon:yes gene_type:complete
MEKINEMLIGALALVGGLAGFATKRIFKNTDTLSDRISALESVVVTKEDLASIKADISMIVTHLITKVK